MAEIVCRLVRIDTRKTMNYFMLPDQPNYEMVPEQLYYGQADWKAYPDVWIDSAWSRTKTFAVSPTGVYLPNPEWKLGQVGFCWISWHFGRDCAMSKVYGHTRQKHLKFLRELGQKLVLVKTD